MSVRIITDSASDMSPAEHPALRVLPLSVTFGTDVYMDGVDIDHQRFYEMLVERDELPKTGQVNPYAFSQAIAEAREAGDEAVIITVGAKLSGTNQSARTALAEAPGGDMFVVDSNNVTLGERVLVEYALRLVDEGQGAAQVAAAVEAVRDRVVVIGLLETLEYLVRGGRLSAAAGAVGTLLNVKPVVAAEDGIMPQTVESINHAKAAGIPIIVAINKMDKPEANPERIKQQLTEYGLVCEEWGGDTIICPISAKTGMGIDNLLEMLTLTAEVGELKANPHRAAQGTVIEARLDKGRGPVATLLVQNGTLHQGDIIIAGTSVGRVRAMVNDKGQRITEAGPSVPVEITGLSEAPSAGATFNAVADEKLARELVEQRKAEEKAKANAPVTKVSLEDLFSQIQAGEMKNLNLIVKADVQGSVEAVKSSLEKLSNDEVRVRVIHGGVGAINESDVMLASTSQAIIVGFNVRPDAAARDSAARANVDMRMYRVIYDAINEVEAAMKGMLAPKFREVLLGHAEVRQTYKVSGVGTVAGCYVLDGKLQRKDCQVRLVRDGIVIHEGVLASLQRFKDSVKEVVAGYECGLSIEKFNDIKEGDVVEAFTMEQIQV